MKSDTEYFRLAAAEFLKKFPRQNVMPVGEWLTCDLMEVLKRAQQMKDDDEQAEHINKTES